MSTDELVKLYKELRVKQLLLLHDNFFDEIAGDWAKRCYKAISKIKNLQTLSDYLATVPQTLLNLSFEEVVNELLKRGRKLIR